MNFDDITKRLSSKQKQSLRNAKTQEELNELIPPEKVMLTDEEISSVTGGQGSACFRRLETTGNVCATCGMPLNPNESVCSYCGNPAPVIK